VIIKVLLRKTDDIYNVKCVFEAAAAAKSRQSRSASGAMATHSCTLAWKIPWMEEPGRLPSIGSLRVGHD